MGLLPLGATPADAVALAAAPMTRGRAVPNRFHLAWFMNFVADEWSGNWGAGGRDWSGQFYVDMARELERACFDYMIIEDKVMVSDAYGGNMQADLKHGINPKHDPVPLAVLIAQATSRLGVVATMSSSFYPPFLLARLSATVDHIANGRFGWNIVTSGEDRAAQNFGLDRLYEHDERYAMATEYVDLVCQLWDSWDADAVVRDRERGVYADHSKVHTVDFEGTYYRSRGPLNTVRPPQGHPVLCQAGASPRGREFAARTADTIIAAAANPADMKAYRNDIHSRMEACGRKPDDCKVLFLVSPVLGDTTEEAQAKKERWMSDPLFIEYALAEISAITEIDFSQFDLDQPLPSVTTNGERGSLENFARKGEGKTLRQLVSDGGLGTAVDLVGTPDDVAEHMGEIMDDVGGDGFLITSPVMRLNRRYITEITDGLIPALQRRDLVRSDYTFEQFRDNLLEF
jgi:FMN-dependent oxidoreductase (nitrilotriacetate monooxygenase family)